MESKSTPTAEGMTDDSAYTLPKVWTWNKENGGQFANINHPVAGDPASQLRDRHEKNNFDTKTQDKVAAAR